MTPEQLVERDQRDRQENFIRSFNKLAQDIHQTAVEKGFYSMGIHERNKSEMLCLIHSEVSEALEALRKPHVLDKHLPHLHPVAVELADVIIRIMDMSFAFDYDVAGAVIQKMAYNKTREHKHGKEF